MKGTMTMKTKTLAAISLAAAIALTGCGGPGPEVDGKDITEKSSGNDVAAAYVNEMTRVADALESIEDEASARKAAAEIRAAGASMETMAAALEGSGMSQMQAATALSRRGQDIAALQTRIMTQMMSLQAEKPELAALVGEEIDQLGN